MLSKNTARRGTKAKPSGVGERRRLCCLSRAIWVRLFQRSLNLLFLWLAQHLAANLLRGRSAVAVAAAAQKAVGDDSASRRAHAAAHPHVRNRYASTSNKGPRREPFERLRWRLRNMVEITPQYPPQPTQIRRLGQWMRPLCRCACDRLLAIRLLSLKPRRPALVTRPWLQSILSGEVTAGGNRLAKKNEMSTAPHRYKILGYAVCSQEKTHVCRSQ
jgi:hypothetical protein